MITNPFKTSSKCFDICERSKYCSMISFIASSWLGSLPTRFTEKGAAEPAPSLRFLSRPVRTGHSASWVVVPIPGGTGLWNHFV